MVGSSYIIILSGMGDDVPNWGALVTQIYYTKSQWDILESIQTLSEQAQAAISVILGCSRKDTKAKSEKHFNWFTFDELIEFV